MGNKVHAGLHPKVREEIEKKIVDTLSQHGALTSIDLRFLMVRNNGKRNVPLPTSRIAQICKSLRKRGVLAISGEVNRRNIWMLNTLKQY